MPDFMTTSQNRRLAYYQTEGQGPGVVFLGGFRSDMEGTKALALEEWAQANGRAFLRFDYSGHGASDGVFEDGAIGDWLEDARDIITELTQGPQVLVGSSMGGWISLLLCREMAARVAGLVTIAAAPDFTEDGYWASFSPEIKHKLESEGQIAIPSEYGDPMIITRRLINEGRNRLVLRDPLPLPFPVRFLQGTADDAVPVEWAYRLLEHAQGDDMRLTVVKGADHRFSDPICLEAVETALDEVLQLLA
ncbi:alpha/beta hydrolase [Thioclava sp. SK-1]|uniref:alpha/beta hydrolase n=1 Tax=Thioclava sp. SK-1 TaxID=1889770 RepID=UPI000826FDA0|nr:alpha/beta hydrolase [Thioclava sp. SK-1]OCX60973.1 alpha/beta hydrolase [Thioclava sp. SK-1]